jgi:hypothetical protein
MLYTCPKVPVADYELTFLADSVVVRMLTTPHG